MNNRYQSVCYNWSEVTESAAYIAGEKIKNERDGKIHNYTNKSEVVYKEILLPTNAPSAYYNRTKLWNAAETIEKRKNSQTARSINAALPKELSRYDQIELVQRFCEQCFVSKGMCCDFAIHDKGDGNPHVHILLTTRKVDKSGFTKKERSWNDRKLLLEWREAWADWCNYKLHYVSDVRVDHRSYKEQGVDKLPQIHLGAKVCAVERKGFKTDKQFGFEGGNILEPSMGVGNFFAKMPDDIRDSSKLYGVELDSISGRIAQLLNLEDRIQVTGFEKTRFNNNSFDVVIGNVPFGDYRVSDKAYDKLGFKIHDYFAVKSIDKVKPGGVVAIVTSKFTMDKLNDKARRYLAERCDLLGAVRLPNNAFKKSAGTETTTDILFFQKRETLTVEVPSWVHFGQTADGIPCNQYFVDNPDMVLGTMAWDERMKGKYGEDSKVTTCVPNNDISLSEQLKNAISKINGKIETVTIAEEGKKDIEIIPADPSVRNYTHAIVNGKLFFRENEIMTEVQETGKTLDRMMGMHLIRQKTMALIDAQAAGCSDEELKKLQADLNYTYDKFKRAYGAITDRANERVFQHDDDYNTLAALEVVDSEKKR